jgi:hypothetical protein
MKLKNYLNLFALCFVVFCYSQPPAYVPTTGLVAWWGMANANDDSTNANHLTPFNLTATTDRFGTNNAAYSFNGTSSYLTKSSLSQTFSQAGSFSVSVWIKKSNSSANVALMSGSSTASNFVWLIQSDTSLAMFGTNKQGSSWFWRNAITPFVVNVWEHYVGVYAGNIMTFYRNGVLQGSTTNTHTGVSQASMPMWIGRGVGGNYFNGSLDDIGIWNRVLNANEIALLYQSTLTISDFSNTKIKLYPNPTDAFLSFDVSIDFEDKSYEILDELGRIVKRDKVLSGQKQIDVSAFKTGLYFFKVEGLTPVKFIKK